MICIQNGLILNLEILKKMALHIETELGKLKNIIIKIGDLAENQVAEAVKVLLSEPVTEGKEVKKTEDK